MGKRYNNYNNDAQAVEEEIKPAEENFMETPAAETVPVKEETKPVETVPVTQPVRKDNSVKRRTVTL